MGAIIHFFQVPLYRELSVVALILLLIVVYYFRYVHFAKLPDSRLHRRWLDKLISGTRRVMIVMVLALVALVVYDRVVMPRLSAAAPVKQAQSSSKKPAATSSSAKKTTKADTTKKQKAKASSSSSGEIIDATEHALSTQQYHDLLVVQNYFKKNPDATSAAEVYRYRGQVTGNAGLKVTEIGGYKKYGQNKLKLTHLYWVYPSGQFDVHR